MTQEVVLLPQAQALLLELAQEGVEGGHNTIGIGLPDGPQPAREVLRLQQVDAAAESRCRHHDADIEHNSNGQRADCQPLADPQNRALKGEGKSRYQDSQKGEQNGGESFHRLKPYFSSRL